VTVLSYYHFVTATQRHNSGVQVIKEKTKVFSFMVVMQWCRLTANRQQCRILKRIKPIASARAPQGIISTLVWFIIDGTKIHSTDISSTGITAI
jgi:hypothetical protein